MRRLLGVGITSHCLAMCQGVCRFDVLNPKSFGNQYS